MKKWFMIVLLFVLSGVVFARQVGRNEIGEAFKNNQTEKLLELFSKNPDLLKMDLGQGLTALHMGVYYGNPAVVDYIVKKGYDIGVKDQRGMTPVWYSVSGGRPEMLKKMIALGADLKIVNPAGDNMLFRAASGKNLEVVRILLENGFRPQEKNKTGLTPVFAAARVDALDIVKLLAANGADLTAGSGPGSTLLHEAAASGGAETLKYLLDNGLNIEAWGADGMTPLQTAVGYGNTAGALALIQKGADFKTQIAGETTPLFMAVNFGNQEIASALAERGADVNAADANGLTPFFLAVQKGWRDIIRLFLSHKADFDAVDPKTGKAAFHEAALRGYTGIVEDLIKAGVKKDVRDRDGRTALSYAWKYGHKTTAEALARHGVANVSWETNLDDSVYLKKELAEGQAYIWYLKHSGWAVKTKSAILVFDYWDDDPSPDRKLLANGHIDPEELKTFPVYVFVSHEHGDHFDRQILEWKKTVPGVQYVFGFEMAPGADVVYTAPRTQRTLGPLTVTTIRSSDAGAGFVVQLDGLTLFHAGDHSNNTLEMAGNTFYPEIDYLAEKGLRPDIGFFLNMFGCGMTLPEAFQKGIFYAVDKLKIKTVFPMHGAYKEWVYADLKEAVAKNKVKVEVGVPANPGDRFFFKGGALAASSPGRL